jgi:hypothetical protein
MERRQCAAGRVHKPRIGCTAVLRPVSGRDGDAGNGSSGRAMPTTARTRLARNARGPKAIVTTGASIGARIRNTAGAIATRRDGGNAIVGSGRRSLQRWTRHPEHVQGRPVHRPALEP